MSERKLRILCALLHGMLQDQPSVLSEDRSEAPYLEDTSPYVSQTPGRSILVSSPRSLCILKASLDLKFIYQSSFSELL